jgi:tetratricopeptide (TPR) repeat protein
MSLLMQALKKAERAKRSGLQEPEPDEPLEARAPAREPYVAADSPAMAIRHELSLEPIEAAQERPHDPVPPQARHEVPHATESAHSDLRNEPDIRATDDAVMATAADMDAIAAASAGASQPAAGPASGANTVAPAAGDTAASGVARGAGIADPAGAGAIWGAGDPQAANGAALGVGAVGPATASSAAQGVEAVGPAATGGARGAGSVDPLGAGTARGAAARAARAAAGESAAARRAAASASSQFSAQGASLAANGPARARTAADIPSEHAGLDAARLRIAGLSGLLVLILGIFGYVYWKATMAPGPGAGLPMVPMPPPSATGASGIIVTPAAVPAGAGQYAGGPGIATDPAAPAGVAPAAIPGTSIAATPPQAAAPSSSVPPAVSPSPAAAAPVAAAPVRAARPAAPVTVPAGPTAAQIASIEDPAMRREAMRDAADRQARAIQEVQASQSASPGAMPAAAGAEPATLAAPVAAGGFAGSTPAALANGEVRISRSSNAPVINPSIQSGYAAFQAGDLAMARQQYQLALGQDPTSRDALLGIAAVSLRENQGQQAAATYIRLLELDASDPDALAGLVTLRAGDMQHSESRLKELLRRKPEAGPVHFALGNLYAKQARWTEAQQSFFRAYSASPSNPDYAFNLAIGLDRLNQPRLAASYYQRALLLVQTVPASFDRTAAERRLRELGGPAVAP